jgi:Fuc2NAc and GlcNAc transferase
MFRIAFAIGAAAVGSWLLSWAVLRRARAKAWLDVPNERSSHTSPTPRGGGLAILAALAASVVAATMMHLVESRVAIGIGGGAILVGLVGFVDDLRGLRPFTRAAIHIVAAALAIAWTGGPPLLLLGQSLPAVIVAWFIAILVIVWCVNLYNFMDGIDGLAASEAVIVGAAAGLIFFSVGAISPGVLALLTAASSLGFVVWNWQPAKIFMGDVGSGTLGFVFGALAVTSQRSASTPMMVVLLLLAVFIADATITLLRRMLRGERWYEAHRSHAYQRLVQHGWSHATVTLCVIGVNLGLALLAWWGTRSGAIILASILGYGSITALYLAVERIQPFGNQR